MTSEFRNNKLEKLKDKCLQYLGGKKCNECGSDYLPLGAYHFHHRNNKDFNISKMIGGSFTWKQITEELDKCVILCANCHASIHARH